MKNKRSVIVLLLTILLLLAACTAQERKTLQLQSTTLPAQPTSAGSEAENPTIMTQSEAESGEESMENSMLKIEIGNAVLTAEFADTPAAQALKGKLKEDSVTVDVSNYGGWEKVGDLPWSLPASDVQTGAVPGDIMLYCGNSIVLFYGSNRWAYTRLGTIVDSDADSLARILGGNDSKLTLSLIAG